MAYDKFTELTAIQNIKWEQGVCAERILFFNGSTPESQSMPEGFCFSDHKFQSDGDCHPNKWILKRLFYNGNLSSDSW
jgi:hypothetical protein